MWNAHKKLCIKAGPQEIKRVKFHWPIYSSAKLSLRYITNNKIKKLRSSNTLCPENAWHQWVDFCTPVRRGLSYRIYLSSTYEQWTKWDNICLPLTKSWLFPGCPGKLSIDRWSSPYRTKCHTKTFTYRFQWALLNPILYTYNASDLSWPLLTAIVECCARHNIGAANFVSIADKISGTDVLTKMIRQT